MNGFLKNGLLVVGGVVLGSMVTQKAIVDTLHSKEIAMRQNWRECRRFCLKTEKARTMCLTIYAGLSRNTTCHAG